MAAVTAVATPIQAAAAAPVAFSLCGRSASSETQLYFDVAKSPFAQILRATDRETILEDEASGTLWTFVIQPVALVACRSEAKPEAFDAHCDGEPGLCASLVARLRADPRAEP